jgi:hypothetical protein
MPDRLTHDSNYDLARRNNRGGNKKATESTLQFPSRIQIAYLDPVRRTSIRWQTAVILQYAEFISGIFQNLNPSLAFENRFLTLTSIRNEPAR